MEISLIFKYIADIFNIVPPNLTITVGFWFLYTFVKAQNKQHDEIKKMFEVRDDEHSAFNKIIAEHQTINNTRFEKGNERFGKIESNMDQVYLIVLRDTVYNEKLAIKDRLAAFNEYRRMGGNGYTEVYYETHLLPIAQKQIEVEKINSAQ